MNLNVKTYQYAISIIQKKKKIIEKKDVIKVPISLVV